MIVVDGLPQSSLYLLDPNDITSIKVLKDAASAAQYGILGNAGVVEITTHRPSSRRKLNVGYHSNLSYREMGRAIPVADRERFLEAFGRDIGTETDWAKEITENSISHGHYLRFSQKLKWLGMSASLGYRNNKGILKTSGFEQYNGRLAFDIELDKKTKVRGQLALTERKSNFSFPSAFYQAIRMNPTAPVRSEEEEFDEYDHYFQFTDRLNPVALIEQNVNIAKTTEATGHLKTETKLNQHHLLYIEAFGRKKKYIGGFYHSPQSPITDKRNRTDADLSHIKASIGHKAKADIRYTRLTQHTGLSFHKQSERTFYERSLVLKENSRLSFSNLDQPLEKFADFVRIPFIYDTGQRVASLHSSTYIEGNGWELNANLGYEGVSYVVDSLSSTDMEFGLFYGATLGIDLIQFPVFNSFTEAKFRMGYGKTGGLFSSPNYTLGFMSQIPGNNLINSWGPVSTGG